MEKHETFLALVETEGKQAGIKWDDLIIRFEWLHDIETFLQNPHFTPSEEMLEAINKAKFELKYNFNVKMIDDWKVQVENKEGISDLYEDFEKYALKNANTYVKAKL